MSFSLLRICPRMALILLSLNWLRSRVLQVDKQAAIIAKSSVRNTVKMEWCIFKVGQLEVEGRRGERRGGGERKAAVDRNLHTKKKYQIRYLQQKKARGSFVLLILDSQSGAVPKLAKRCLFAAAPIPTPTLLLPKINTPSLHCSPHQVFKLRPIYFLSLSLSLSFFSNEMQNKTPALFHQG